MSHRHASFLGCPLDALSRAQMLARAETALGTGTPIVIEGINVAKLIQARRDPSLMQALEEADIVHTDGAGIMLGAKILGHKLPPRRAGVDLMMDLLELCAQQKAKVFLLGAKEEVVHKASVNFMQQVPGLEIAGIRHGYFPPEEAEAIAQYIKESGAALLLVGMSSPHKELFLQRYRAVTGVKIAMGVGGAFDITAGHIRRAPVWMQRAGLEWAFRLMNEPRRLFWRYLQTNTLFALLVLRTLLLRSKPCH